MRYEWYWLTTPSIFFSSHVKGNSTIINLVFILLNVSETCAIQWISSAQPGVLFLFHLKHAYVPFQGQKKKRLEPHFCTGISAFFRFSPVWNKSTLVVNCTYVGANKRISWTVKTSFYGFTAISDILVTRKTKPLFFRPLGFKY